MSSNFKKSFIKKITWFVDNKKKRVALIILLAFLGFTTFTWYMGVTRTMPQSAIYLLNELEAPKSKQKILVFSPHPDDETLAAGGYIAEAVKNGADVRIILVTNGNKFYEGKKRKVEFQEATNVLGVKQENLVYLDYKDSKLKETNREELKKKFKDQIDSYNPDIVIYPSPEESHPDHRITGEIVSQIIKDEHDGKRKTYRYLVHQRYYPQPHNKLDLEAYILPPSKFILNEEWQKLMLSQSSEDQKHEAVLKYRTQLEIPFMRGLLLSFIRKNELFEVDSF